MTTLTLRITTRREIHDDGADPDSPYGPPRTFPVYIVECVTLPDGTDITDYFEWDYLSAKHPHLFADEHTTEERHNFDPDPPSSSHGPGTPPSPHGTGYPSSEPTNYTPCIDPTEY